METWKGKVAVITGAASGIGRAIAERCLQEGMSVVLADIERDALRKAEKELQGKGAFILAVRTDVSEFEQVQRLAEASISRFKEVHLLFNNAGVGAGTSVWASTIADWQWVLGVNLWGVIHGVKVFVPIMLRQDNPCYIVNTASVAGLISGPGLGIYKVTKHAVISLSETLFHELEAQQSKISVSVVCPGWVQTRILSAERNRPKELRNKQTSLRPTPQDAAALKLVQQAVENGTLPSEVAKRVFDGLNKKKFYIITSPETRPAIRLRLRDVSRERRPKQLSPLLMLLGSKIAARKAKRSA